MLPEVVCLAKTNDMLGGNTYLLRPDFKCFLVVFVDRGPKEIFGYLKSFGEEFPRPLYSFLLEIVTEREVSEHFKERAVSCGVSNTLKVRRTDTFLTGANAISRRLLLTREVFLHGRHARVDKQKRFVVYRNEREGGKAQMSF